MTDFVADSSVVLSWLLIDEGNAEADRLLESLATGAVVESPVLLRYEVANVLVTAFQRRKRISREACFSGLKDFERLPIRYDAESPRLASSEGAELAEKHFLSVYDAAYLLLAKRSGLPLATLDEKLGKAARLEGIHVMGIVGSANG